VGILPSHIRRGPCQRTKAEKLLEGGQDVKYHEHIEGGHYKSVTTGFRCVDFRRWYLLHDEGPKPTKNGVALCLDEWAKMRSIVDTIGDKHSSQCVGRPMLPARSPKPDGGVRVSTMSPLHESAYYIKRREWHSYVDDAGHLHLCWRVVELIEP